MAKEITLIEGDGIGPEVTQAAKMCIEASGVDIVWSHQLLGETALKKTGALVPDETIASIRKNRIALKGPATTPIGTGFRSVNVQLRKILDLYVNLRPALSMGINQNYPGVDIVVVRENTEDLYVGIEFDIGDNITNSLIDTINKEGLGKLDYDTAISLKTISKKGSERIIRFAFEYAIKNNRKKVSCVHKANILKYTDGLFLKTFYEVAKDYEGKVQVGDYIVDKKEKCLGYVKKGKYLFLINITKILKIMYFFII